jgi:hypothetical protein
MNACSAPANVVCVPTRIPMTTVPQQSLWSAVAQSVSIEHFLSSDARNVSPHEAASAVAPSLEPLLPLLPEELPPLAEEPPLLAEELPLLADEPPLVPEEFPLPPDPELLPLEGLPLEPLLPVEASLPPLDVEPPHCNEGTSSAPRSATNNGHFQRTIMTTSPDGIVPDPVVTSETTARWTPSLASPSACCYPSLSETTPRAQRQGEPSMRLLSLIVLIGACGGRSALDVPLNIGSSQAAGGRAGAIAEQDADALILGPDGEGGSTLGQDSSDAPTDAISPEDSTSADASCGPDLCRQLRYDCGTVVDGCGRRQSCGTCLPPDFCAALSPNHCGFDTPP